MINYKKITPLHKPLKKVKEEKNKQYWIITNTKTSEVLKNRDGTIMFFEYVTQAINMIDRNYNNSPYLKPRKWKNKKNTK